MGNEQKESIPLQEQSIEKPEEVEGGETVKLAQEHRETETSVAEIPNLLKQLISSQKKAEEDLNLLNRNFTTFKNKYSEDFNKYNQELENLKGKISEKDRKEYLIKRIKDYINEYQRRIFLWSGLNHLLLILSVISSVIAIFVLKMESLRNDPTRIDWATGLMIAAASFVLLSMGMRTREKSASYEKTINNLTQLQIEIANPELTTEDGNLRLKNIISEHNKME